MTAIPQLQTSMVTIARLITQILQNGVQGSLLHHARTVPSRAAQLRFPATSTRNSAEARDQNHEEHRGNFTPVHVDVLLITPNGEEIRVETCKVWISRLKAGRKISFRVFALSFSEWPRMSKRGPWNSERAFLNGRKLTGCSHAPLGMLQVTIAVAFRRQGLLHVCMTRI